MAQGYFSEKQPRIFKDKYGFLYKNKRERASEFYPSILGPLSIIPIVAGIGFMFEVGFLSFGAGWFAAGIGMAAVSAGFAINGAINKKHSRELFEIINDGDVKKIEEKINKISKKTKRNKKHILNDMRDKNGDTLIASIINSDKIEKTKKEELINKLIKNGAKIDEKNATFKKRGIVNDKIDGKTPIDIAKDMEESEDKSDLINFLKEKYKERLKEIKIKIKKLSGWRRLFSGKRIEKLNKKAEKIKNIFNNLEGMNNDIDIEFDSLKEIPILS